MIAPPLAAGTDPAVLEPGIPRRDDRFSTFPAPLRPFPTAMLFLAIGSLIVHAVLVATAVVTSQVASAAVPREISVEIIPEPKTPPAKPPPPLQRSAEAASKAEAPKPAAAEPAPAKPQLAKLEVPTQETPKPAPKPEPVRPPPHVAAPPPAPASPTGEVDAMRKELEALKEEQAALRAQTAAREAAARSDSRQDPPQGQRSQDQRPEDQHSQDQGPQAPMDGSRQALALPGSDANGDDAVAYQDLVFSQLAKAKGFGEYHGAAGTTGVHFAIDDTGRLTSADVAVSSGNGQLDAEALAIVKRAGPFPPPPKDSDHSFVANVNFVPPKQP